MTECIQIPPKIYFKPGCTPVALRELREIYKRRCAFLAVGEKARRRAAPYAEDLLRQQGLRTAKSTVPDAPAGEAARDGLLPKFRELQPDAVVGIGGAAALAAARWLWEKSPDRQNILLVLIAAEPGSGQNILAAPGDGPSRLPQLSITDPLLFAQPSQEELRAEGSALLWAGIRAFCRMETTEFAESFLLEAIFLALQVSRGTEKNLPALWKKLADAAALYELGTGTAAPGTSAPLTAEEKKAFRPRLDRLNLLLGHTH